MSEGARGGREPGALAPEEGGPANGPEVSTRTTESDEVAAATADAESVVAAAEVGSGGTVDENANPAAGGSELVGEAADLAIATSEPTPNPQPAPTAGEDTSPAASSSAADLQPTAPHASDELEELILPPSIQPPPVLAPGTAVGPDGRLQIVEHLAAQGRVNRYAATWKAEDGQAVPVEVREAAADHAALAREAEALADVRYAMLPKHVASFEHEGCRYLAVEWLEPGETLEQALRRGLGVEAAVSITLQLAQALRRLHQSGWTLVGLAPADVQLGQPLRLTRLGSAVRTGETPAEPLHVPGASAPELTRRAPVTGKEDVYTLGAILFHALSGRPLPETGAELGALPLLLQTPGGPQLLAPALAPADERIDLEGFYRALLAFKQRLGRAPLALEVASATSVGLNPTRPVNEDSCGYFTWSESVAEGVSYRALLCVCDGMGGMDAGEVASGTALHAIMAAALAGRAGEPESVRARAEGEEESHFPLSSSSPAPDPVALIRLAAPAVHAAGQGRQMGTTATCVIVCDGELRLGHAGDTRAYLLREGALAQLTRDHSLVAAMVASGVLTKEEARGHPDSNKVLRSLGSQRELPDGYVDDLASSGGQPSLRLQAGDWLLLCSDGVWGSVADEQIRTVLAEALDPPTAAWALIDQALRAGAPDNASAVVARCVEMPFR